MRNREIARAGPADAKRVGHILGEAFADDPVTLWILRSRWLITVTMTRLAHAVYVPHGFVDYSTDGCGAAMWLPPGASAGLRGRDTAALALACLVAGRPAALARARAFGEAVSTAKPRTPHVYLFAIGVVPAAQGKGLGGALLRAGLAAVDRAGMPAYLESTKAANIPIYQRYGFELCDMPRLPEGCPPLYPMWRPASAGAAS